MFQKHSNTSFYAPDFELPGINGQVHHLSRNLENYRAVAVVFICNHCPYVSSYLERLKEIQSEFKNSGFTLIAINPNDPKQRPEDSFEKMKSFAVEQDLNFPYLWDSSQDVARAFEAEVTPEAFLIDGAVKVRYKGAIDDNANAPENVQTPYLEQAIRSLLAGEEIAVTVTKAVGSPILWREA